MGEFLFQKWLEECVSDLQMLILHHGVEGALMGFEQWLVTNGCLKNENEA